MTQSSHQQQQGAAGGPQGPQQPGGQAARGAPVAVVSAGEPGATPSLCIPYGSGRCRTIIDSGKPMAITTMPAPNVVDRQPNASISSAPRDGATASWRQRCATPRRGSWRPGRTPTSASRSTSRS